MALLIKAIGGILVIVAIAGAAIWWIGSQQPSQTLIDQNRAIFVALKDNESGTEDWPKDIASDALWKGQAQFTFVGEEPMHWSRFVILPHSDQLSASLTKKEMFADLYAAEIELTQVPSFALGLLRAQHLVGVAQRPTGPVPTNAGEIDGRADILPTTEALKKMREVPPDTQITMMNFLEYASAEDGDKTAAKASYRSYGQEAFKAVHAVGGQFLFAGEVKRVLVESKELPAPVKWDSLAAMIYPDTTAMLAMEQIPDYRSALGERDKGLGQTRVIASIAQ